MDGEWFRWFWLAWAILLVGGFAIVEGIALYGKRHKQDTLSQNVQWLVKWERPWWVRTIFAVGIFGLALWFVPHILAVSLVGF